MFPRLLGLRLPLMLLPLAHPPDGQVVVRDSAGRALLAHAAHVCGPLHAGEVHVVSEDLRCPPAERLHSLCALQPKERSGAANAQRVRLPHKLVKSGSLKLLGLPATEVDLRDPIPRRWIAKDRLLRNFGAL